MMFVICCEIDKETCKVLTETLKFLCVKGLAEFVVCVVGGRDPQTRSAPS